MRKFVICILSIALLLSLCACGVDEASGTAEAAEQETEPAEEPAEDLSAKIVGTWIEQDGGETYLVFDADGSGYSSRVLVSTGVEYTSNYAWSFENGEIMVMSGTSAADDESATPTAVYRYTEDENGITLVDASDNGVFVREEDWLESARVTTNSGEIQTVRARDLFLAYNDNAVKFANDYAGAHVSLVSYVTKIETDFFTTIETTGEDVWYKDMTVLHLAAGWIVSLSPEDPLLFELSTGDPVSVDGYITGMSFMDGIAILRTDGHTSTVEKYDENAVADTNPLEYAQELVDKLYIEDAYQYLTDYLSVTEGLSEEETAEIGAFMTDMLSKCYPDTFVLTYDSVQAVERACLRAEDGVYEYELPDSEVVRDYELDTYTTYLKNHGFTYEDDTYSTVDGESEAYATFENDDGVVVKMAIYYDNSYVRVLVFPNGSVTITLPLQATYAG